MFGARVDLGSYAWSMSGDKTASGNPMLYSGPQMGFFAPSIIAEGSIRGGGLEVSGMHVPGIPAIFVGRTPHHAWSLQTGHAHTVDFWLEAPQTRLPPPHGDDQRLWRGSRHASRSSASSHGPIITPDAVQPRGTAGVASFLVASAPGTTR